MIVVDEGSVDETLRVSMRYPVRILRSQRGRSAARNTGIMYARGQFLMFLDSDMVLESRVVEECVRECLKKHCHGVRIPIRHEVLKETQSKFWDITGVRNTELKGQSFPSDILFWARTVVGDTRFPEDLSLGEDLYFQSRLMRKGTLVGNACSGLTHLFLPRSTMSELLRRSYGYGKLYVKQKARVPLTLLSRSISVVGFGRGCLVIRSLVQIRSFRLFITIPLYLLVKYLGFALGFILSLVGEEDAQKIRIERFRHVEMEYKSLRHRSRRELAS